MKQAVDLNFSSFAINDTMWWQQSPIYGKNKLAHNYRSNLVKLYPDAGRDLYGAFIERCIRFAGGSCRIAMVTMHGFMFIPTFSNLRKYILETVRIRKMAHCGNNAFAELGDHAPAVIFVLQIVTNKESIDNEVGTFHRLVNVDNKAEGLLKKVNLFYCKQESFQKIPGCPFVYWLPSDIIDLFGEPSFSKVVRSAVGLQTGDIPRRVRYFWEITNLNRWRHYYKGGDSVQFYGEYPNVIDWSEKALWAYKNSDSARWQGYEFFGRKGVAYLLSGSSFSARYLPPDFIFDVSGPSIFPNSGQEEGQGFGDGRGHLGGGAGAGGVRDENAVVHDGFLSEDGQLSRARMMHPRLCKCRTRPTMADWSAWMFDRIAASPSQARTVPGGQ